MEYGMSNNIKLTSKIPGRCNYLYADSLEYRADQLFIRRRIPVKFESKEMHKPGSEYVLVFCRFKRKHEDAFLECMADLERAMLSEGHHDYSTFCEGEYRCIAKRMKLGNSAIWLYLRERASMIVTTTPTVEGYRIIGYSGTAVTVEAV